MEPVHFSKRRVVYFLVFVVGLSFCYADKVDLLLKRLNKTPVKSIKSADGDIIDCIHISQQPAFDHPSLKAHSIQRSPSYHPQGSIDEKKASFKGGINQTWHMNGVCPEETIPIRRTTREDILRASSFESFGKKERMSMVSPAPSKIDKSEVNRNAHEYAIAYVPRNTYYGGGTTINLWNPQVQESNEFSLSQIWVVGGDSRPDVNTLEVGWQVYQGLYGDYNTRLFIYWTADGYKNTGCYNLACSGFVQTNSAIVLGGTLSPTSSYMGTQYEISILIWKDPQGGNWWLKWGDAIVGYWPSTMFTYLSAYADAVNWGGEIVNLQTNGYHTTTVMGSGRYPAEGFTRSSYFRNVQIVDGSNSVVPANLIGRVTNPYCYDISIGNVIVPNWGSYFYYGGPGGKGVGCV